MTGPDENLHTRLATRDTTARAARRAVLCGLLSMAGAASQGATDQAELAAYLLDRGGVKNGVCVVAGCGDGRLAAELARPGGLLVYARDGRAEAVEAARLLADQQAVPGSRLIMEKGDERRVPLADNMVDLVVAADLTDAGTASLSPRELLRVLRPRGKALLGCGRRMSAKRLKRWVTDAGFGQTAEVRGEHGVWVEAAKAAPDGTDSWSHWVRGPDNNPVSRDTVIRAPYLKQWLAEPFTVAIPTVTTTAGGRVFVVTGNCAMNDRDIPTMSRVCVRSAFNGTVLWTRKLPDDYLVHRSAYIATDETFYLADGDGCLRLDPQTGRQMGRIRIRGVEGEWKWMALDGDTLYVLIGEKGAPAEPRLHHSTGLGGWSNPAACFSKGYAATGRLPWGWGTTIAALDVETGRLRWTHREDGPIDSRAMGVSGGKVFFHVPGRQVGCLEAQGGNELWKNTGRETLDAIAETREGVAIRFATDCASLCTERVLFLFPDMSKMAKPRMVALSTSDGRLLWTRERLEVEGYGGVVLFDEGRLLIAPPNYRQDPCVLLDPLTGRTVKELPIRKYACTRVTACPDSIFFRGNGLGRYDKASQKVVRENGTRPPCTDGAIPANGLLYLGPWCCRCNGLHGSEALCSAGAFQYDPVATEEDRLEHGEGDISRAAPLDVSELDWPTYRANNQRTGGTKASVVPTVGVAWEYRPRLAYLPSAPAAAGGLVFLCGDDGKVRCLDGDTGAVRWEHATGGPIRLPPTVWDGRAFVGSDDGHVYCLEAASGRLLWRFRAAPVDRRIMVYGALRSTWPVNGGVLVERGVAYACANGLGARGYVYALDARTGKIVWQDERATGGACLTVVGEKTLVAGSWWSNLKTGGHNYNPVYAGPDLGVLSGKYVLGGGRPVHWIPGKAEGAFPLEFIKVEQTGTGPRMEHIRPFAMGGRWRGHNKDGTSVFPAWDQECWAKPYDQHARLVCWETELVETLVESSRRGCDPQGVALAGDAVGGWPRGQRVFAARNKYFLALGRWTVEDGEVLALAMAQNAVVAVYEAKTKGAAPEWDARALGKVDGEPLWRVALPREPLIGGLAIDRRGRVIVSLKDGGVVCLGPSREALRP